MDRTQGRLTHRRLIPNEGIALAVVRAEQRRHGDYSALTPRQLRAIRRVLRKDEHGRLTRDQCVTRLLTIGGHDHLPPEAA